MLLLRYGEDSCLLLPIELRGRGESPCSALSRGTGSYGQEQHGFSRAGRVLVQICALLCAQRCPQAGHYGQLPLPVRCMACALILSSCSYASRSLLTCTCESKQAITVAV